MTFEELGVAPELLRAVEELGFTAPMPVQEAVIPHLLGQAGDLIALAQTGTGKTAAYGLPLLQHTDTEGRTLQSVILCPTRELCLQITDDLRDFARYLPALHIVPVYGGSSISSQIRALGRSAQIIVATPGRLMDLMRRGTAKLETVRNVVLDEADEMLSMGFEEDIATILSALPEGHNTLLFSATMGREVEKVAKRYLHDYKEIVVGSRNEGAEHVRHIYYMVQARDKYAALKRLTDYNPRIFAIVFCRTRAETAEIADALIRDGYNAEPLHGDLSQPQRDITMQKFRQHRTQLLVATDVAARGLDVDDLTHVINYGLPDDIEVYTHRSGRTGRAGKQGTSLCIIHTRERAKVKRIEKTIGKTFERGTLPEAREICAKQLYNAMDRLEHTEVNEAEIAPFMPEVMRKLEWLSREDLVKRIVTQAFGRFLAYYAAAPEIVQPEEKPARGKKADKEARKTQPRQRGDKHEAEEGYKRLFINMGKRDNFYAREIINLINRYTGAHIPIGRIDLTPSYSFFEVPEDAADLVLRKMRRARVGDRQVVVDDADREDRPHRADRADRKADTGGKPFGKSKPYGPKPGAPATKNWEKKNKAAGKNGFGKKGRKDDLALTQDDFSRPRSKDDWKKFFQH
ncbi:MAG: DEAD/DEAH box helicase [Bacteroidaceae bacterium]|nr:DEAD/DEAH box helicase [Bacteroidaceae bacterium]